VLFNFKYFIILIVSTCYLIVHKLENKIFTNLWFLSFSGSWCCCSRY